MTPDEEWRPVVGYEERYEVSNAGRARSLDRWVTSGGSPYLLRGQILKPDTAGRYPSVTLRSPGAKGIKRRIHVLVAESFIGPRPERMDVCHNNGDCSDNRLENLRYDTHANNAQDMVAHGTHYRERRTHCQRDHEFTPENTYTSPSGERGCRTCRAARRRR